MASEGDELRAQLKRVIELIDSAAVWDRLPRDLRDRLAHLVDDPPRTELLVSLLHNIAATINEIERHAVRSGPIVGYFDGRGRGGQERRR